MSGDPFEANAAPSGMRMPAATNVLPPHTARTIREPSVQQAVTFLNDPRVKSADQSKAIDFLRRKGVNDDELREAYRRCSLPLPNEIAQVPYSYTGPNPNGMPHVPPNGIMHPHSYAPQPPPLPPQRAARPSWLSVFFGLTAAAGLYTAVREVLRTYVVPLYFPEANEVLEVDRRDRNRIPPTPQPQQPSASRGQEQQLAELRERLTELCVSSQQTNERVEQLSRSITTSLAMHERDASTASELRDAIRQLSHSISVSDGTELPVFRTARRGVMMEDHSGDIGVANDKAVACKSGSLAYDGTSFGAAVANGPQSDLKNDADDDFMAIQPAQVEESWRANGRDAAETPGTSRVSMKGGTDDVITEEVKEGTNGAIDVGETLGNSRVVKCEEGDENENEDCGNENNENENIENANLAEVVVNTSSSDKLQLGNSEKMAAARRLFESDLMTETRHVFGDDAVDVKSNRPLSMPMIDPPLTDADF